ncbi:lipopolysaccharide biosynthesis protein [Actinomyces glycerinitolerans]|uniref:Polysaccharide biosynthesis protein n=1 Tax=Actinomyces glycerinitolerans TaxID=1892869 RepID=A0A1M4RXM7_9ACTO|nr:lipopolysaccharide biosynthesis protein [Actinomyces glycerinitolerans]SHE24679.1 polysaccharide biosynthesis protein [Actinomyces glycerinitolerans]
MTGADAERTEHSLSPSLEGAGVLGKRAAKAAGQTVWTQGLRILLQLGNVVVLARLLDDRAYGVVGMVTAVVGVATIFQDFGLSTAAIQGRTLSHGQRSNLWWLNTFAGLVLTGIGVAISPLLASFYHESAVAGVCAAIAPTFLMAGMVNQYRADLNRRLLVGRVLMVDLTAAALALALGALTAAWGWSYWALVVQRIIAALVPFIALPIIAGWLPCGYDRREPMRALLGFGMQMAGTQMVSYLASNLDSILMGRLFGAGTLGLYNRAVQTLRTPLNQFRPQVSTLGLAVTAKLQDDDERTLAYLRRGQLALGYPVFLSLGIVVAAAPAVVSVVLGDHWLSVVPYMRLVAVGEGLTTLSMVGGWIYTSRALGRAYLRYTMFSAVVRMTAIIIGAQFGALGVAYAYVASPLILWPVSLLLSGRQSGLNTVPLVWNGLRILAVCAAATVTAWALCTLASDLPAIMVCLAATVAMGLAMALLWLVLPSVRVDMRELSRMTRMMVKR